MSTEMEDPDEVIVEFLTELPTTIRADIMVWVLAYGLEVTADAPAAAIGNIVEFLGAPTRMLVFGRTLRLVTVLDFVLQRSADRSAGPRRYHQGSHGPMRYGQRSRSA